MHFEWFPGGSPPRPGSEKPSAHCTSLSENLYLTVDRVPLVSTWTVRPYKDFTDIYWSQPILSRQEGVKGSWMFSTVSCSQFHTHGLLEFILRSLEEANNSPSVYSWHCLVRQHKPSGHSVYGCAILKELPECLWAADICSCLHEWRGLWKECKTKSRKKYYLTTSSKTRASILPVVYPILTFS